VITKTPPRNTKKPPKRKRIKEKERKLMTVKFVTKNPGKAVKEKHLIFQVVVRRRVFQGKDHALFPSFLYHFPSRPQSERPGIFSLTSRSTLRKSLSTAIIINIKISFLY